MSNFQQPYAQSNQSNSVNFDPLRHNLQYPTMTQRQTRPLTYQIQDSYQNQNGYQQHHYSNLQANYQIKLQEQNQISFSNSNKPLSNSYVFVNQTNFHNKENFNQFCTQVPKVSRQMSQQFDVVQRQYSQPTQISSYSSLLEPQITRAIPLPIQSLFNVDQPDRESQIWKDNYDKHYEKCQQKLLPLQQIQIRDSDQLRRQEKEIIKLQSDINSRELENQELSNIIEKGKSKDQRLVNELNEKENQISDLSGLLCSTKTQLKESVSQSQQQQEDFLSKLLLVSLENERLHTVIIQFEGKQKHSSKKEKYTNDFRGFNQDDQSQFQELKEQLYFYKSRAKQLNDILISERKKY